jgi:type II secretory pathway predicted ATPase ExeA
MPPRLQTSDFVPFADSDMYTQHFGLTKSPFDMHANAEDAFVGPRQAKMISRLINALAVPDAVVAVSGPVGVGKTTLIDCALASIKGEKEIVRIGRMRLEPDDILDLLTDSFGLSDQGSGTVHRVIAVKEKLKEYAANDKRVFFIVEDAQRMGIAALLELESMTAAESSTSPGASVILMGQTEMHNWLSVPDLVRVSQRTRLRQSIEPFNAQEVQGYLTHCLRAAGGDFDTLIRHGTVQVLHSCSGGIARIIRNLCETTFKTAADADLKTIAPQLVAKIATDVYGLRPGPLTAAPAGAAQQQARTAPRPMPQPGRQNPQPASKPAPHAAAAAPAARIQPQPAAQPAPKTQPQPAAAAQQAPQAQPEPAAAAKPAVTPQPEPAAAEKPEAKAQPEPAAAAEPEAKAQPEPAAAAEPEAKAPPEPAAAAEPEAKAQPEPAAKAQPEAAAEPEAEAQPEPAAADEAEAVSAADDADESEDTITEDPTNPHLQAIVDQLPEEAPVEPVAEAAPKEPVAEAAQEEGQPQAASSEDATTEDARDTKDEKQADPVDDQALVPDLDALEAAISAARREPRKPAKKKKDETAPVPSLLEDIGPRRTATADERSFEAPDTLEKLDDAQAETLFGEESLGEISAAIAAERKAANADNVKFSLDLSPNGDEAYGSMVPDTDTASTQPRKILPHRNIPESHADDASEEAPPDVASRASKS